MKKTHKLFLFTLSLGLVAVAGGIWVYPEKLEITTFYEAQPTARYRTLTVRQNTVIELQNTNPADREFRMNNSSGSLEINGTLTVSGNLTVTHDLKANVISGQTIAITGGGDSTCHTSWPAATTTTTTTPGSSTTTTTSGSTTTSTGGTGGTGTWSCTDTYIACETIQSSTQKRTGACSIGDTDEGTYYTGNCTVSGHHKYHSRTWDCCCTPSGNFCGGDGPTDWGCYQSCAASSTPSQDGTHCATCAGSCPTCTINDIITCGTDWCTVLQGGSRHDWSCTCVWN